jgi:hypothetical protein
LAQGTLAQAVVVTACSHSILMLREDARVLRLRFRAVLQGVDGR